MGHHTPRADRNEEKSLVLITSKSVEAMQSTLVTLKSARAGISEVSVEQLHNASLLGVEMGHLMPNLSQRAIASINEPMQTSGMSAAVMVQNALLMWGTHSVVVRSEHGV